jgi:hypothetical protein
VSIPIRNLWSPHPPARQHTTVMASKYRAHDRNLSSTNVFISIFSVFPLNLQVLELSVQRTLHQPKTAMLLSSLFSLLYWSLRANFGMVTFKLGKILFVLRHCQSPFILVLSAAQSRLKSLPPLFTRAVSFLRLQISFTFQQPKEMCLNGTSVSPSQDSSV